MYPKHCRSSKKKLRLGGGNGKVASMSLEKLFFSKLFNRKKTTTTTKKQLY